MYGSAVSPSRTGGRAVRGLSPDYSARRRYSPCIPERLLICQHIQGDDSLLLRYGQRPAGLHYDLWGSNNPVPAAAHFAANDGDRRNMVLSTGLTACGYVYQYLSDNEGKEKGVKIF